MSLSCVSELRTDNFSPFFFSLFSNRRTDNVFDSHDIRSEWKERKRRENFRVLFASLNNSWQSKKFRPRYAFRRLRLTQPRPLSFPSSSSSSPRSCAATMIHLRRNSRIPGRTVSTKRGRKGVYRVVIVRFSIEYIRGPSTPTSRTSALPPSFSLTSTPISRTYVGNVVHARRVHVHAVRLPADALFIRVCTAENGRAAIEFISTALLETPRVFFLVYPPGL